MSTIIERFSKIKFNITQISQKKNVNIIAISKTFSLDHIKPLIDHGHDHFGENKVQEALSKWNLVKKDYQNINLHMVGKLQSNKAKDAIRIFDYIHSLDNKKLADLLAKYQRELNKNLKYFIQVNIGNELQKSGISVIELEDFYNYCTKKINLNVLGLMIIPPNDDNANKYFKLLYDLNIKLGLKETSMGMSADYQNAIRCGSTFIRLGSAIFGERS